MYSVYFKLGLFLFLRFWNRFEVYIGSGDAMRGTQWLCSTQCNFKFI